MGDSPNDATVLGCVLLSAAVEVLSFRLAILATRREEVRGQLPDQLAGDTITTTAAVSTRLTTAVVSGQAA